MNGRPGDAIGDDDLHALVDGQLAPERIAAVLAWLREHPDDALRVASWQAQRLQLKALQRALPLGDTPAALTAVVRGAAAVRRRRLAAAAGAAAAVLLGTGLVVGRRWPAAGPGTLARAEPPFVRDAVLAHAVYVPEARHPVEVSASDEAHLVQWLTRRLGTPVRAPSLQAHGYRLLGGRLLPGPDAPRAQFMYEDGRGRRVTLYLSVQPPGSGVAETSFRSAREGGVESFYWIDGRVGYALSGEVPSAEMMALAREVYRQLPS